MTPVFPCTPNSDCTGPYMKKSYWYGKLNIPHPRLKFCRVNEGVHSANVVKTVTSLNDYGQPKNLNLNYVRTVGGENWR